MRIKRALSLLALSLLASASAFVAQAQVICNLQSQTNCSTVYAGGNPTLGTFLSWNNSSFAALRAQDGALPQPKMILTGQNMACAGAYLSTSPVTFGNGMIAYSDILAAPSPNGAGVTIQDCNVWGSLAGSMTGYTGVIASDCAGGATIAKGASAPGGTAANSRCAALVKQDALFAHMQASGYTLRVGFPPAGGVIANSNANGGCGLTVGSVTVAQYNACLGPIITAFMNRYGSQITAVQVLEEPIGEMLTVNPAAFSVAQTATIITTLAGLSQPRCRQRRWELRIRG